MRPPGSRLSGGRQLSNRVRADARHRWLVRDACRDLRHLLEAHLVQEIDRPVWVDLLPEQDPLLGGMPGDGARVLWSVS